MNHTLSFNKETESYIVDVIRRAFSDLRYDYTISEETLVINGKEVTLIDITARIRKWQWMIIFGLDGGSINVTISNASHNKSYFQQLADIFYIPYTK